MGLLDDAIREHLDLKRQHGAAEDELARQEAEALGPVTEADMAAPQEGAADEPEIPDGERVAGWPFDRVAENELAGEPEEPSFEWGEGDSGEVEVPSFVPAEPISDPDPDAEPEFVDSPTVAFDVLRQPVSEKEDELAAPEPAAPLGEDPLVEDLDPVSAGPETEFMPALGPETDEPEPLGPGPLEPEPPDLGTPPTDLELSEPEPLAPTGPEDPAELSRPEPFEPDDPVELSPPGQSEPFGREDPVEPSQLEPPEPFGREDPVDPSQPEPLEPLAPLEPDDPVEAEVTRAEALPVETEPPLSEPEPLEPYPREPIEASPDPLEPEPSADPGEAPLELDPGADRPPEEEPPAAESVAFAPEPPLLEESEERPREESAPPIGPAPSMRLDPTAEQGDPPGTAGEPLDADADPPTQAWSIHDEVEEDLGPPEVVPIEERPVFEPVPDAEERFDDVLEPPSEHGLDFADPVDTELDPEPAAEEEPPPREQPPAARGFFEETEEHETLWHEERPGADPDFEN